ncbi:cytochrome P450 [Hypomontagnella submonticulosa]|nr:cytochrome P450 [Hypomontagnella submonticulosa]
MNSYQSTVHVPWLVFGTVLLATAYVYTKISFLIKLRHIKGSWATKLSEIPHTRAILSEECQNWYAEVNKNYGPIAHVSPRILATSSPELWVRINAHPGYTRSDWFYRSARFDWRRDNVFSQIDVQKHELRRKQMIAGYSGRENATLENDIDICISQLLHLIRSNYAGKSKLIDLAEKLQFLTLDVISTIGFGKCFGLLDADDDPHEYVKTTEDGLRNVNRQMALGTWRLNLIIPKTKPDPATATGFEKMLLFCFAVVDAREKAFKEQEALGIVEKADMLTSFMKNGLLGDQLKAEVLLQIVAGSDTTAGGLRGMMLYILTNPRVYKKLLAEIEGAVQSGKVPPTPEIISYNQAKQLVYLQAVIREVIRIFPPLNDPLARDTPPDGDTITIEGQEVYLPGGVSVIPSFIPMFRNTDVYGEDVDMFRPERWLDEPDKEKLDRMKWVNDLMFGHGKYLCLGKGVAMMEMSKALFELLRNFDWGLSNPEKPWKMANFLGLRAISDMWVCVEERPRG